MVATIISYIYFSLLCFANVNLLIYNDYKQLDEIGRK